MLRGGCLTYMYSADETLYNALTFAVKELLKTTDKLGRISTYSLNTEFCGWDLWSRKYVLSGLQHFYSICKDVKLKKQVMLAMEQNADYICENIGEGKKNICDTSNIWGGLNSCTILEPFVELYKLTSKEKYLKFAEYIIKSGGCRYGNMFESASKIGCYPKQYPTTKAYETMSLFEGLLAYYEVKKNPKDIELVKKFVEDAFLTERSVIGGLSGKGELFDGFYESQTEKQSIIVQETCVTVTWIRLLARLYLNTGDVKYIERIERSGLNALWGSLNVNDNKCYSSVVGKYVAPMPFDSYSPLVYDNRGKEIGGFKLMEGAKSYGCCACIGSAGVALIPLLSTIKDDKGIILNYYFNGNINTKTPLGKELKIQIISDYPANGKIKVLVSCESEEKFIIKIRKPSWAENPMVNGVDYTEENGYFILEKEWKENEILLDFKMTLKKEELNGKTAFSYGPLVLALDEGKGNKDIDK
ncbi:MAG: glycoside hydrolase family 127 protein, partial [Clostridia bacterium]|nr:glycoside hydrolase family 127 protein [Clostridia bacterium]